MMKPCAAVPPIGYALATSLLFSGSYVAGKYTTLELDPLTTTLFRYVVALGFLLGLVAVGGVGRLKVPPRHWLALAMLGLTGIVGYHYFFFLSLRYTAVANTAIINALSPVFTSVAAAVFLRERLARRNYLGVAVAVLGVVLLLSGGEVRRLLAVGFNRGDLLMLAAVLCFVIYALVVRALVGRYGGLTLVFYATLTGVLLLLVVLPFDELASRLAGMSRASVYAVLYMGIAGSGLGYLTFNLSLERLGATRTSSFVYGVIPMVVAVLAFVFFGQPVTLIMLLSAALIVAGLRLMLDERGTQPR